MHTLSKSDLLECVCVSMCAYKGFYGGTIFSLPLFTVQSLLLAHHFDADVDDDNHNANNIQYIIFFFSLHIILAPLSPLLLLIASSFDYILATLIFKHVKCK